MAIALARQRLLIHSIWEVCRFQRLNAIFRNRHLTARKAMRIVHAEMEFAPVRNRPCSGPVGTMGILSHAHASPCELGTREYTPRCQLVFSGPLRRRSPISGRRRLPAALKWSQFGALVGNSCALCQMGPRVLFVCEAKRRNWKQRLISQAFIHYV